MSDDHFFTRAFGTIVDTALVTCVVAATGALQNAPLPSGEAIRTIIANRVDVERQHVGVVVGVIEPSGRRVVGHGTFGKSDSRRVDGTTMFEIGSVTKVFTSVRDSRALKSSRKVNATSSRRSPTCSSRSTRMQSGRQRR